MLDWSVKHRRIAAGIVLLLISIGYGYLTSELPKRTLPDTPDPAFMPWINTIALGVLALLLLRQGERESSSGGAGGDEPIAVAPPTAFIAAFLVFILLLPYLGFVLSGIPFFAAMMLLFGERRIFRLLAGSVGGPIILFAVFRFGFNIILPRGLIGGLIG